MPENDGSKAKGGFTRAELPSPEKRKKIASKAAEARWAEPLPIAIRQGELSLLGKKIPCAVIDGEKRILSQAGFLRALGRARSPKAGTGVLSTTDELPFFLQARALAPFISEDLRHASKPVFYLAGETQIVGYAATLLPQVCEVYLRYRDHCLALRREVAANHKHIVETCDVLMRSLSGVAMTALVDEASGYQQTGPQKALQAYLEKFVTKELAAWAKKFPNEFYENIYKLKHWPWPGMGKNRYSATAQYTNDLIYERLAPGAKEELQSRSPRDDKENKIAKAHQWLTEDIGDPMLAQHLYSIVMFQRLALSSGYTWKRFVKMVDRVHPKRGDTLDLPFPELDQAAF